MMRRNNQTGFTLVELSIVFIIIGLILGGILVGRDLMRASEVRSVIKDFDAFQSAINTFKLKYNGLPGDLTNATDYWGADASCPNTPTNTALKEETCNGTGDGRVQYTDAVGTGYDIYERYRFWQQLANAGLIPGRYTGVTGPLGAVDSVLGVNVPAARRSGTAYGFAYSATTSGDTHNFPRIPGHHMWFGFKANNCTSHGCPSMTPAEHLSLDQKLDDGFPGTGMIRSGKKTSTQTPNCVTSDDPTTAVYDTSAGDQPLCTPQLQMRGI